MTPEDPRPTSPLEQLLGLLVRYAFLGPLICGIYLVGSGIFSAHEACWLLEHGKPAVGTIVEAQQRIVEGREVIRSPHGLPVRRETRSYSTELEIVVAAEDGPVLVLRKELVGHIRDLAGKTIKVLIHPTNPDASMPAFQAESWLADLSFPIALALVCFVVAARMFSFQRDLNVDRGSGAPSAQGASPCGA